MCVGECVNVKFREGWKALRAVKNDSRSSVLLSQIRRMYCFKSRGRCSCVCKNRRRNTDMNMLAMVGENAAPIAVPLVC